MKRTIILFFILLPILSLHAQEALGPNPPGIKWRQIGTPAGRVIFPEGLDTLAMRTARLVNYQRRNDSTIVGPRLTKPVPHIIHNRSVLPAGFSTPAPWRNEYFITPPANMFLGPVSWTDAMELHEYRHTQQFYMAHQGFTRPYQVVMGQTGWLFNSLMTQPLWFREGDAVLAETIFTNGGRGRLPSFHMEYRAMRLAGYYYNYEKAHFTSFRDYVPNPYRLGYYLVTKARRDYGNKTWYHILDDTYRKKGFFYPFSRSMQKYTGFSSKEFYHKTVTELDSLWKAEDKELTLTDSRQVSQPDQKKYTSYRFPQFVDSETMVVLKSGLDLINTYYLLQPEGKEEKLFSPGLYTEDHVTLVAENGKMVWAESGFHERYINKDYSIIKTYDFKTGKTKKLSSRSRYFSPAISKDGKKVFVTETDYQNKFYYLLLDAATGNQLKRSGNPQNLFLTHPRWMDDHKTVVVIAVSNQGNTVARLNTETNELTEILPYTYIPFSRPFPHGDYVYFSAGFTGINNIYALHVPSARLSQVTSVRFGAFEPVVSPQGDKLIFSEYTADGYRIMDMDIDPENWKSVENTESSLDFFLNDIENTEEKDITEEAIIDTARYKVKKFNSFTDGLFNFYGWLVLPNIPEYGLEIYTRNIMSTLRGTLGLLYNTNENRFHYYGRASYAAFYPVFDFEYHYGNRRTALIAKAEPLAKPFDQSWREQFVSAGMYFPFRLTQGTHITTLQVGGWYEKFKINFIDSADSKTVLTNADFDAIRTEFIFSRLKVQARQHVKPRWGQVLKTMYGKGINNNTERLAAHIQLYFPGLARTHSFNIGGSWKKEQVINTYRFTDDFILPRGYRPFPFEQISLVSLNYELPLFYPDLALGSVAFIQRIRTNLFYDYSLGVLNNRKIDMNSPGAEIFADLRLFRLFQMTMGVRFNYVTRPAPPSPELTYFQFLVTRFELVN